MGTHDLLIDAGSCVYTSADLTMSTVYQTNTNKVHLNVSFVKYVPTPIIGDDGEIRAMRVANIDLDIDTAKTLVQTLAQLIRDVEKGIL